MLLATPFFITKLGVEQMGIWMLINSVIGSLNLLNGGFGDASIKFISKYNALNEPENVKRIVNTIFSFFILLTIAFVVLAFGVLISEDYFQFFSAGLNDRNFIFKSLYVVVFLFSFKLIEQILLSFFKGYERYDIASKFSIFSKTTILLANVALAAAGYSLLEIFMSSAIISLIMVAIELYWLKKHCPFLSFHKNPDKSTLKEIAGFSIWAWLQTLAGVLFSQADKFVVAACAGLSVLTYYSIGFMVANQIHALFAAASSWLFPVVSKKIEQKSNLFKPYYKTQFFMILGGLILIAALYGIKGPLFETWLGSETYTQSILLIKGFLLFEILIIPFIVPFYFFNASGYIKTNTLYMLASNILMLLFMYIGYVLFGLYGLIGGRIVGTMIVYLFWIISIHRLLLHQKNLLEAILVFMPSIMFVILALNNSLALQLIILFTLLYFLRLIYLKIDKAIVL